MSTKPLFTDFGLDEDLTAALRERGIVHPFPIQELTLPLAIKGHDIIGQARTGTGKTLAFGLPLLQHIDTSKSRTQALVIVPTRELCIQVADDLTVGADRGVTTIAVYGGVGYDEQIEALTTGVHVVIGTPGRTIDHLNRGNLDVSQIHTVVLDEADEMLDMGFLPDVERLLVDVPEDRQTLLFSATMPTEIVKLARRFMAKPTFMRADETLHETAPEVDQHFFLVHRMDKPRVLARLLQKPDRKGAFVFCRTKRMCDRLVQELDGLGVKAIAVHGDLRQSSREKNLDQFREGKADVLVATEVAARGLDVSNVTYVINYDCPDDEKMYLHRIGRTARAGESGVAVTFAEFNEVDRVNVIRKRVAAEEELVEVFSTSDELTGLFDLPETTPWDDLATTSGSGSGSSSSSRPSSSSSRARKSSSGSNRSSSRGSDRSGGSRRAGGRHRKDADTPPSTAASRARRRDDAADASERDGDDDSRRRSRTRSRTSAEAVVAKAVDARDDTPTETPATDTSARDGAASTSRSRARRRGDDGGRKKGGSSRGDAGGRGKSPSDTRKGDGASGSDRDHAGADSPSTDRPTGDGDKDQSGDKGGRTRARPRARRNRDASSSSSTGSKGGRSTSKTDEDATTSNNGGGRTRRESDSTTGNGTASSGRGRSRDGGNGRDRDRGNAGSQRDRREPDTTSRGDEARGGGTPRPRRRVAVEHLP